MSLQRSFFTLKLVMLVAALVAVFYLIRHLNEDTVAKSLQAIGVEAGGSESSSFKAAKRSLKVGEGHISICRTRVKAMIWPDGRKIQEAPSGMRAVWFAHDPTSREINSVDVEKWLSQHCEVIITPTQQAPIPSAEKFLTFEYVDGSSMTLARGEQNGVFHADHEVSEFFSEDLEAAVAELRSIAQFGPAGH